MVERHEALRKQLTGGVVLTPGDEEYGQSLLRWSHAAIKPAAVVVQPASPSEASIAVKYATSNDIPLVVMGGGHSTSGASSSDGGMVIDLRRMNHVRVDKAASTVTFGGGCRWKEVDETCWEQGLATVGGTVNDTGVGGLTLGGGYGWLSSKYGLVIDNLVEMEVVLADGSIVKASDKENPDLFWALRGAGQNFGVVTSFTSKVYPQKDVWSGALVFTLDKTQEVVDFANWFHEHNTGDQSFWFGVLGALPGVPMSVLFCMVFHDGTEEEAQKFFKPLLDLGPMANMTKSMPYKDVNEQLPNRDEEKRRIQGGANFVMPLHVDLVKEVASEFESFIEKHNDMREGSGFIFEIFPHDKIRQVAPDATAFPSRGHFYHATALLSWEDPALDQEFRVANRKLLDLFHAKGFKGGGGQYNNYDGDYLAPKQAFGVNLARLQELKKKYDPANIFCKWHSVWPREDRVDVKHTD